MNFLALSLVICACHANNNGNGRISAIPPQNGFTEKNEGDVNMNADIGWSNPSYPLGSGALSYHSNGLILTSPKLYVLYYGTNNGWSSINIANYFDPFFRNIGSSNYLAATRTQLKTGAPSFARGIIVNGGTYTDPMTSDSKVASLIYSYIAASKLQKDANGLYVLMADSYMSKYLTRAGGQKYAVDFCGYHSTISVSGFSLHFAVVGTGAGSTGACKFNYLNSYTSMPSQNLYTDYSLSVAAHEIAEGISDPNLNAWFDNAGYENGDKCNGIAFAANKVNGASATSGPVYNVALYDSVLKKTVKYLLQANYDNEKNVCPSVIY